MAPDTATVTLDGSDSSDPDMDSLTYAWTQTPTGTQVMLTGADTVNPTFTAPSAVGALVFELTVNDGTVDSTADTVTVTVNTPPVADAGMDQAVQEGNEVTVTLSGFRIMWDFSPSFLRIDSVRALKG